MIKFMNILLQRKYNLLKKRYEAEQRKSVQLENEVKKYKSTLDKYREQDNENTKIIALWREEIEKIKQSELERQKQYEKSLDDLKEKKKECDRLIKQTKLLIKHSRQLKT